MPDQRSRADNRRTAWAIGVATAIVVGGWAVTAGLMERLLPSRSETPIEAQEQRLPHDGAYDAARHGKRLSYWGRTYEVVGRPVRIAREEAQAAGTTENDVFLYFRRTEAAELQTPRSWPQAAGTGQGRGGGGGALTYPDDKGTLFVKVGPDVYRAVRRVE